LGGAGADEHVVPTRIRILPGDLVQFVTLDHRVHRVVFGAEALTPESSTFLRETGQDASPPLLERGSRFVVFFEKAPSGLYPFVSHGSGGSASGIIEVLQ
jgi:plastocyanin